MSREYECEVRRVVDGDTFDVEVDLGFGVFSRQRLRLLGVDTPETWRPSCEAEREHGEQAKSFATRLVLGQTCRLVTDRDRCGKYGRCLATLFPPGSDVSLNQMLRDAGLLKREYT